MSLQIGDKVLIDTGEGTTGNVWLIAGHLDSLVALVRLKPNGELIAFRCHVSHLRKCSAKTLKASGDLREATPEEV